MDRVIIASLTSKFLGLYTLIQSIPLIGNISQMFVFAGDDPSLNFKSAIAFTTPAISMVVSGLFLIICSNKIAKQMLPKEIKNPEVIVSNKDIQSIAFSVVGLVMIVLAFPKIIQIIGNVYALKTIGDESQVTSIVLNNWTYAIVAGFQFIGGLFLFIGGELLSSGWHFIIKRLRYEKNNK